MTGRDLQWQDYEIPIGGLDEGTDRRLLAPGQFATVLNCEFTSVLGSVRKRPGTILVSGPPVDGVDADPLPLTRFVTHEGKNQLLAVDLEGSLEAVPALYAILDAPADGDQGQTPRRVGAATNALVRRYPLANDLASDILMDGAFVQTATSFGYMVYGYVLTQSTNGAVTGRIGVKVVQVRKSGDTWEPENTVIDRELTHAFDVGDAFFVRAAPSLDSYVALTFGYDTGHILGCVVDCGSTIPTVGSLIDFITDGVPGQEVYHDIAEDTGAVSPNPEWVIVYQRQAASDQLWAYHLDASLVLGWGVNVDLALTKPASAASIIEKNGRTWVNWYSPDGDNPGWYYTLIATATGALTLAQQRWCGALDLSPNASISAPGRSSACAIADNDDEVILFHSQCYQIDSSNNGTFWRTPLTRWRRGSSVGGLGGLRQKRGVRLRSKVWAEPHTAWYGAWVDVQRTQAWVPPVSGVGGPYFRPAPQYTFSAVQMRFAENEAAEADLHIALPVATTGLGAIMAKPWKAKLILTGGGSYPMDDWMPTPNSVTHSAYFPSEEADIEAVGRRCVLNFRYVPTEEKHGPWDIVTRSSESDDFASGYGRYTTQAFGGATIMAGGLLTEWDGDRHHENNFLVPPDLTVQFEGSADDWPAKYADWGGQFIYLQALYESVLENGERVRSASSGVFPMYLGDGGAAGQPSGQYTLHLEPLTVTMRSYGGLAAQEYIAPRTLVTVYGSADPSGSVLHRWFPFGDDNWTDFVCDPDALEPITMFIREDLGGNSPNPPYDDWYVGYSEIPALTPNEVIYTDSGELDNDAAFGGCSTLVVHKDRLWIGGGDDAELLWYSKERVDGRPAEFALGQQIRLPGARVTALASLDDALIVFCEHKIFAVYGEGPVATGDPASGIFTIVPVSTSVGCAGPGSITTCPAGIFFKSEAGLCLLNRGRTVEVVNAVVNSSSQQFTPIAASVIAPLQQARIVLPFDGLSDVLVYDWDAQKWATWRYAYAGEDVYVRDVTALGRNTYILTNAGNVYREDESTFADDGESYRQVLTTGWISFGRLQGYKRIHQANFLMEPNAWADHTATPNLYPCGLRFNYDLNYAEAGFAQTKFFSNYELGQILPQDGISWLRMHLSTKQPSVRVQIAEQDPVLAITAPDNNATIDTTLGNNVLKLRIRAADAFSTITATSSATLAKSALLATVTAAFVTLGWTDYVRAYLVGNRLVIETTRKDADDGLGSHLEVDSVANGSTLNTPLSLNVAGEVGLPTVAAASQSGFVLQSMSFEVGQARGARRLPAAQSK